MTNKLTLDALQVLDAIDRKGSFAAAAADLYRVPSAVTYSVRRLEEDLRVTLFRRQGRRSVLTPAGQLLLAQGRELLEAADRLVEATRQLDSGWESTLGIAVDSILAVDLLFPHLRAFYAIQADTDINISEEVLVGAWEALIEGRADLVVGATEPSIPTQGLRFEPIGRVEWLFAVAPDHPLTQANRPLTAADIEVYPGVVVKDSSRNLPPLTRRVFDRQPLLRVPGLRPKVKAQCAGLGVGFLPRHRITAELDSGALVALEVEETPPPETLYLAWNSGNRGRALRWFIERLREAGAATAL